MNANAVARLNPLLRLKNLGQAIWLDYTSRDLIISGQLRRWIEEDGLRGMTSNPSIFEHAIQNTGNYDEDIHFMAFEGQSPNAIYESLSQSDIRSAADEFRSVYDRTDGQDGYVSLEVNPHLAHDTKGTIIEARRLWRALARPNVFIKVPATIEGLPAIQQLISEGINVNITLLFGLPRYRQVASAYIAGLEARLAQGQSIDRMASVASFFLSRIDTLLDPSLEKFSSESGEVADLARKVKGEIAISSAVSAYQIYKEIFTSERFTRLAGHGARVQRLLWASTSTKNPKYNDLKYVEPLIAADTVNTVTIDTLNAYRDHGQPREALEHDVPRASWVLQQLPKLGINLDDATQQLEDEGVEKFNRAFDNLIKALKQKSLETADTHTNNLERDDHDTKH
jgi:transaldolase